MRAQADVILSHTIKALQKIRDQAEFSKSKIMRAFRLVLGSFSICLFINLTAATIEMIFDES
jgi:hypothetical protein